MSRRYDERPLVYIAAPYSKPDPVENTHSAVLAANELLEAGLVTPHVPHLTYLWHLVTPKSIDFWYEYDLALLRRCDALLRLPGHSTGADREIVYAEEIGVPVFRSVADLEDWARVEWAGPA